MLQDCGHVMEVDAMDSLMLGDRDAIEIRKCPFCRKPIINTGRYKDFVNKIFKEDINPIKTRIFGTKAQIAQKKAELLNKIKEFRDKYVNVLMGMYYFRFCFAWNGRDAFFAVGQCSRLILIVIIINFKLYLYLFCK